MLKKPVTFLFLAFGLVLFAVVDATFDRVNLLAEPRDLWHALKHADRLLLVACVWMAAKIKWRWDIIFLVLMIVIIKLYVWDAVFYSEKVLEIARNYGNMSFISTGLYSIDKFFGFHY